MTNLTSLSKELARNNNALIFIAKLKYFKKKLIVRKSVLHFRRNFLISTNLVLATKRILPYFYLPLHHFYVSSNKRTVHLKPDLRHCKCIFHVSKHLNVRTRQFF